MRTEKIALEHKSLLHERLKRLNPDISEYSFPNLYLYRAVHDYEVVFDGEVFISGRSYDGHRYIMPTSDIKELDMSMLKALIGGYDFMYPVSEDALSLFDERVFKFEINENDSDYVYTIEKMRTYAGRKLHNKRNLLKLFTSSYRHKALPLINNRMGDAEFILNDWLSTSGQEAKGTDYYPCLEAIKLYDELIICGGIFYAEGEPAGFLIGEELNPETFVLHFAKGRTKFKGIYQYMFNKFAGVLPSIYKYINFEQDIGRAELRSSKSSYLPDIMVRKARVRVR